MSDKLYMVIEGHGSDNPRVLDGALDQEGAVRKANGYIDRDHKGVVVVQIASINGDVVWPEEVAE